MRSNSIKTFFFLVILMALFIFIGGLIGGRSGAIVAFVIALGANFFSYWFSGSIVLKMYKAQVVTDDDQPELVGLVRGLAAKEGMPMPKVASVPNPTKCLCNRAKPGKRRCCGNNRNCAAPEQGWVRGCYRP